MGNLLLATPEIAKAATVVGVGSEAATTEATNLQDDQPGHVWIAPDPTLAWVELQAAGGAVTLDTFALLNGILESGDQWRIRAAATQADLTASPGWNSGLLTFWPAGASSRDELVSSFYRAPAAQTFEFWRFDVIVNSGLSEVVLGNLVMDLGWQPSRSFSAGIERLRGEGPDVVETEGESEIVFSRTRRRGTRFELDFLSEAEALDDLDELFDEVGESENLLVLWDPEDATRLHRNLYFGRLRGQLGAVHSATLRGGKLVFRSGFEVWHRV